MSSLLPAGKKIDENSSIFVIIEFARDIALIIDA